MGYLFRTTRLSNYLSLNHKFNKQHLIKFGYNIEYQYFNMLDSALNIPHTQFVTRWDFIGNSFLIQPFVQWKWRVKENLDFTAGLHSQFHTLSGGKSLVEPRIGFKNKFKSGSSIFGGAGLHSQMQPGYTYLYQKFDSISKQNVVHNKKMD